MLKAQDSITLDPGEFDAISVKGNIRTEIIASDRNRLEITTEGVPAGNIIFKIVEGELSFQPESGTPKDAKISAKVYFTELTTLRAASGALIRSADTLKADLMNFESMTGGKIELKLNLKSLTASTTQAGLLVFYGQVGMQEVEVTSGATYSAYDLVASESYVKASTGGTAKVHTTLLLDASAKLTGFIGYKGNPAKKSINSSLGGKIVDYSEE